MVVSSFWDKATWVGSCDALLALIIAIYAAYISKRTSQEANENNTFISLTVLVEGRSKEFVSYYEGIEQDIISFQGKLSAITAGAIDPREKDGFFLTTWSSILEKSAKMRSIFTETRNTINHSKLSESSKLRLRKRFFELLDGKIITEIMFMSFTQNFMAQSPINFKAKNIYYKLYKE
ncbi:hypothetical protein [Gluconobacter morbifer]|uniref:hypothetical protein n=1 Tax=Gluconobacter morbifer TaxID=479935 RepID=UPI001112AC3F|nr:hypothetical protein [Gluconobacter morbifer]